jgi:hypothetical protein
VRHLKARKPSFALTKGGPTRISKAGELKDVREATSTIAERQSPPTGALAALRRSLAQTTEPALKQNLALAIRDLEQRARS